MMHDAANIAFFATAGTIIVLGLLAIGFFEVVFRRSLRAIKASQACFDRYVTEHERRRSELRRNFARSLGIELPPGASFDDLTKALEDHGLITRLTHKQH